MLAESSNYCKCKLLSVWNLSNTNRIENVKGAHVYFKFPEDYYTV
jgi:hypothetical protein